MAHLQHLLRDASQENKVVTHNHCMRKPGAHLARLGQCSNLMVIQQTTLDESPVKITSSEAVVTIEVRSRVF